MLRVARIEHQHGYFAFYDDNPLKAEGNWKVIEQAPHLSLRCPHCSHIGSFGPIGGIRDFHYSKFGSSHNGATDGKIADISAEYYYGIRMCPNPECKGLISVLFRGKGPQGREREIVAAFPPELIDFDASSIPSKVADAMIEAVACSAAGAYRASALMVRRALEVLCEEKQAAGNNLKQRVENLGKFATISPSLLKAADHLRILGNDAAHVEAKVYDEIEKEHAHAAIDLAKEILKAVYQHDDLVARLAKLAKPTP